MQKNVVCFVFKFSAFICLWISLYLIIWLKIEGKFIYSLKKGKLIFINFFKSEIGIGVF